MNVPIHGQYARQWLRLDCKNYRGDRPCAAGVQGLCPTDCGQYDPMGHRIIIIKLGALGDVIRTAALLPGLKKQWPQSHITWISKPSGVRMLKNHPLIDRLLPFDAEMLAHVHYERFDLCLSLDKEPGPTALAMQIDAPDKRGIGLSPHGTAYPLNAECGPYFQLGLDDRLKFHDNDKTYQELIYAALGLPYDGERYRLYPGDLEHARAAEVWRGLGIGDSDVVVGFNTGAGRVFANKNWPAGRYIELGQRLMTRYGWRIALLGGPEERELNARIAAACPGALNTGTSHAELDFAALVQRCQAVLTGDTMAMHVAIACDVPCVVLFGPTCEQEIDVFGRGEKIVTTLPCSPCYRRRCDKQPNCMDELSVDAVQAAVERAVSLATEPGRVALPVAGGVA